LWPGKEGIAKGSDLPGDNLEDLPGDTAEDLPGDIVEDLPGDIPGDLPGDLPGEITGDLPGDNPGDGEDECLVISLSQFRTNTVRLLLEPGDDI